MSSDRDLRQRLLALTLVAFEVFQGNLRINAGDISGIISSRIEHDVLTVSAMLIRVDDIYYSRQGADQEGRTFGRGYHLWLE
jgi:hypothetical protein